MKKLKIISGIALVLLLALAINVHAAEVTGSFGGGVGGSTVGGSISGGTGSSISGSVSGGGGGGGNSSGGGGNGGGSVLGASTGPASGGGNPGEVLGASISPLFPRTGLGPTYAENIAGSLLILASLFLFGLYRKVKNAY